MENEPQPVASNLDFEEDMAVQNDFLQEPPVEEPVTKTLYFEDDEEDYQPVKSSTNSPNPLAKIGFGVIIGAIIGGLVVQSLTPSNSEVAVVKTQQAPDFPVEKPVAQQVQEQTLFNKVPSRRQKFQNANEIEQVLVSQNAFHMGCSTEFSGECLADEFPLTVSN